MSAEDAALLAQLTAEIAAAGFDPPEWTKLQTIVPLSKQRAKLLEDLAKTEAALVGYGPQMFISSASFEKFKQAVAAIGAGGRKFKLADVRDKLNLTRRVVQPLLEQLDRIQFTKRVGDERVLVEPR
ncbi:MAG: SelB C-terminal domain-containing protein [Planctomycetes bacterium]|nr:SelB C-terminal domain-containing protein [Planctomycetota bacterium]